MLEKIRTTERLSMEFMWFSMGMYGYGIALIILMLIANSLNLDKTAPAIEPVVYGAIYALTGLCVLVALGCRIIRNNGRKYAAFRASLMFAIAAVGSFLLSPGYGEFSLIYLVPSIGLIALQFALIRESRTKAVATEEPTSAEPATTN